MVDNAEVDLVMNVLGIHEGHTSTACLLVGDKIVACASEERFTRIKNQMGTPFRSMEYVLEHANLRPSDLDLVVMGSGFMPADRVLQTEMEMPSGQPVDGHGKNQIKRLESALYFKVASPVYWKAIVRSKKINKFVDARMRKAVTIRGTRRKLNAILKDFLGIDKNKIIVADHHSIHAYAALFSSSLARNNEVLVFTMDGAGDFVSSTVNIWNGENLKRIASTPFSDSLGDLWHFTTSYLGMKPMEHEYKVMGLAPYAPKWGVEKVLDKIRDLYSLKDDLTFEAGINTHSLLGRRPSAITKAFQGQRFDYIAGAVQELTEDVVTKWVEKARQRTKIDEAAFGGGVFMNIKLNMNIAQNPELDRCFFMPSASDESLAIGAAYYGYYMLTGRIPRPLENLYLGPSYSDEEIRKVLDSDGGAYYQHCDDIESVIAELLVKGEIVGRFSDRMEWGARALGNRSILSSADDWGKVQILNAMIKQRDFWMPFAPTIIEEQQGSYVCSPDPFRVDGQYMIVGFEGTELARKHLGAAMHPYDFSIRPQLLPRSQNPEYHKIINIFAQKTGRNGILNTSFNLHGEPIVCSPYDAISTFERSGLEYLAIGEYLVQKRNKGSAS